MKKVPTHVAIIMDGNGRWAKEKGEKRSYGHKYGAKTLESLALYAKRIGIKYLSVYAFSTDNFKRSEDEVSFIMDLLVYYCKNKLKKLGEEGVRVIFSGRREGLRSDVLDAMEDITKKTSKNNSCTLNVCLNYGGQEEIIDAFVKLHNDINNDVIKLEEIDRETLYKYMYQDLPPIDLLIRTGKEHRLSNFMLYQMFYAELYFVDTYFPDFKCKDLDEAIKYYNNKERRFGNAK